MVRVSAHAIERYRRRVEDVSDAEAFCRLSSPTIQRAADLGASAVILPGGLRVILSGRYVVTIVPKSCRKRNARNRKVSTC